MNLPPILAAIICLLALGCRPTPPPIQSPPIPQPVVYETVNGLHNGMSGDNVPLAPNDVGESEVELRIVGIARESKDGRRYCGVQLVNSTDLPFSYDYDGRYQVQESVAGEWVDKPIFNGNWGCGVRDFRFSEAPTVFPNRSSFFVVATDSSMSSIVRPEIAELPQIKESQKVVQEMLAEHLAEKGEMEAAAKIRDPIPPIRVGIEYWSQESERKVLWSEKIDLKDFDSPSGG